MPFCTRLEPNVYDLLQTEPLLPVSIENDAEKCFSLRLFSGASGCQGKWVVTKMAYLRLSMGTFSLKEIHSLQVTKGLYDP